MQRSVPAAALLLVALVLVLLSAPPSSGRTWYIKADGTGDAPTIQAGVDSSAAGDTVLVAPGTYGDCTHSHPYLGSPCCVVLNKGIVLRSESGPAHTVIDAQGQGRGIAYETWNCSDPSSLEGFTVTGGQADTAAGIAFNGHESHIVGNVIVGNTAAHHGGGMFDFNAWDLSNSVAGNLIEGNTAAHGAGVYLDWGTGVYEDNTITHNIGTVVESGALEGGIDYGVLFLTNSTIVDNDCDGVRIEGPQASVHMTQCTVAGNTGYQLWLWGPTSRLTRILTVGAIACFDFHYENNRCEHCDFWGDSGCCDYWITPNLNADPLFCDPGGGDFTLAADSPCLPENNQWGVLVGALGEGCGPITRTLETWARIKARYR